MLWEIFEQLDVQAHNIEFTHDNSEIIEDEQKLIQTLC